MDVRGFLDVISAPRELPGDYYDAEGFLCCGKCRTRKQADIPCSEAVREGGIWRVPIPCRCEAEEEERFRLAESREKEEKLRQNLLAESGLSPDACLANDNEPDSKASKLCRKYCAKLEDAFAAGIGILFYGGVGTGKSYYAQCVGNEAVRLYKRVLFVSASNITSMGADAQSAFFERLSAADLLILDDLGAQRGTSYGNEALYNTVNNWYKTGKPLIATTNLDLSEIKDEQDITYKRIYDRLLEMCPMRILVDGASKREQIARKKREAAKRMFFGEADG